MTDVSDGAVAGWQKVCESIERACKDVERQRQSVRLVCVSKTYGSDIILPVLAAGQVEFGENRVQEAMGKWPQLRKIYPNIKLHLIGPLQTNKVREAVALFDVIETLDREKLALTLANEIARTHKPIEFFVQVNTGLETQKAGVLPREVAGFVAACRDKFKLNVTGLMCIPPVGQQASPHFAMLAQMAKQNGLSQLSMGMSADFELGIQLGATHVRVGSAIFGSRH